MSRKKFDDIVKRLARVETIVVGDTVPTLPTVIPKCKNRLGNKHHWSQHTAEGVDDKFSCIFCHITFRISISED